MRLTCLLCNTLFSPSDYDTPQTSYLTCPPCRKKAVAEAKASENRETSVRESQTEGNGLAHRQRNAQDPRFSAEAKPKPPKRNRKRTPKASSLLKKAFPKQSEYRKRQLSEIKRKAKGR